MIWYEKLDKVPESDFAWLMALAVKDIMKQEEILTLRALCEPYPNNINILRQLVSPYTKVETTDDILKEKLSRTPQSKPLVIKPIDFMGKKGPRPSKTKSVKKEEKEKDKIMF